MTYQMIWYSISNLISLRTQEKLQVAVLCNSLVTYISATGLEIKFFVSGALDGILALSIFYIDTCEIVD